MPTDPTGWTSHIYDFHRGISSKQAVRVATTANITLSGAQTIDGVAVVAGNRVLVKDQTTASGNGLYLCAAGAWTRAPDMDQDLTSAVPIEEVMGAVIYVIAGTVNGGTLWRSTNTTAPTLGSTSLTFAQITSASSGALPWFTVTAAAYGATGNGATDDTAAINLAIAAYNAAGGGVLYFPHPTVAYHTTSALTTITAPGLILGDGDSGRLDGATTTGTLIRSASTSANLFTVAVGGVKFRNLALLNNAGTTPTAGAGIAIVTGDSGYSGSRDLYSDMSIAGFYRNIDHLYGALWNAERLYIINPVLDGIRSRNISNEDAGDQSFDGVVFQAGPRTGANAAGLRLLGAGGTKLVNCKVNYAGGAQFTDGIYLDIAGTINTSILLVTNCSIENVSRHGIHGTTSAPTSKWGRIIIRGNQFNLGAGNTSGHAIKLNATTLGDFYEVVIDGNTYATDAASILAAVSLTKVDLAVIGPGTLAGFDTQLITSGCTNITDSTAGSAIDYAETGDLVAVGETASAGVSTEIPRADHVHTITDGAVMNAGYWDVVVSGSAPPVAVSTPSDDDWIVAWVNT